MLRVGLTGSIAVGKSFVVECLRGHGCHVLDADQTAREVVEPGTIGLQKIVDAFGSRVLAPDGQLDRKKLGAIVFADHGKREELNSIVHPLVIDEQDRWLAERELQDPHGIAVVDAALMIEARSYKRFDTLVVVWCRPEIQLQRLMARDCIDEREASKRILSQMSQEEKKGFADHLIDTSAGFDDTRRQVDLLYAELRHQNC